MWLSGQQKRPVDNGEGMTGIVTMSGGETAAVLLDSERRGLQVYGPGGYTWTPRVGQRVLVIQGQGEIPCVAGVRQGQKAPERVSVEGRQLALRGETVSISAQDSVVAEAESVRLNGQVYVKEETLEELIARIVRMILGMG